MQMLNMQNAPVKKLTDAFYKNILERITLDYI